MSIRYFIFVVLVCSVLRMDASHIIGGSIHYDDLGNGDYQVTLTLYRDCSSNTEYDDPASIGCFNSAGDLVYNLEIDLSDAIVTSVPSESYSACFVAPLGLCVEEAIYSATVNLPPIAGGYTLTYQRCCRNFSIINVPTGTDVGITLTTGIPGPETAIVNSNPFFATHPPLIICLNAPFVFDHSAEDADGDQLVYEFCAPLNTNVNGTYINPPGAPPYPALSYNGGYSAAYPIDANPVFAINPTTGIITGTPNTLGQYVIGVCISEYRNGVLINQTNRDFQLNVTTCEPTDPPAIADQSDICGGLTVQFNNESLSDLTYHWDFGVTNLLSDTSNVFEPTYTFPAPGTYEITLILNPGLPCVDTTTSSFFAAPALDPVIGDYTFECVSGELIYAFTSTGGTNASTAISWDFGSSASPATSSVQNPIGVTFSQGSSNLTISLEVEQDGCTETTDLTIAVPDPVISSIQPQTTFCDGYTYAFTNLSENATTYLWDFGSGITGGSSADFSPTYTYPDTGYYTVTLIAMAENLCPDTSETGMLIYGMLDPYFDPLDPQCFEGNGFDFVAQGATTNDPIYSWDFGTQALPISAGSVSPQNIHYNSVGKFEVTLTIAENDCLESYSDSVEVILNPVFEAISDTVFSCEYGTAHFHGNSVSEYPVHYFWDFGDGQTSTEISPTHQYLTPGVYDVSVDMSTSVGCIEQDNATFNDVIVISTPPEAGFIVSNSELVLPGSSVEIISTVVDGLSCYYQLSDGGTSNDCDFIYIFNESGEIIITQTVTDQYGCSSTIVGSVVIDGFVFYAPNAFTPDNDGLNDVWIPKMTGFSEYRLVIYDRWGEAIFETDDQKLPWVGDVHNGEYFAQDGVYNYRVFAKDIVGLPKEFSGHIVLFR